MMSFLCKPVASSGNWKRWPRLRKSLVLYDMEAADDEGNATGNNNQLFKEFISWAINEIVNCNNRQLYTTTRRETWTFVCGSMVQEWSSRTSTRGTWSSCAAKWRAVSPFFAWQFTCTLPAGPSSNASISTWPSCAARCSAVYPACHRTQHAKHCIRGVQECVFDSRSPVILSRTCGPTTRKDRDL